MQSGGTQLTNPGQSVAISSSQVQSGGTQLTNPGQSGRSLRCNHTCQCSRLKRRSYGASYGNQHAINMQSHLPMLEAKEEIVRSFIRHRQRVAWQAAIDELPPVAFAERPQPRSNEPPAECKGEGEGVTQHEAAHLHATREVQSACKEEGGAISMQGGGRCNLHARREVQSACNEGGAIRMHQVP